MRAGGRWREARWLRTANRLTSFCRCCALMRALKRAAYSCTVLPKRSLLGVATQSQTTLDALRRVRRNGVSPLPSSAISHLGIFARQPANHDIDEHHAHSLALPAADVAVDPRNRGRLGVVQFTRFAFIRVSCTRGRSTSKYRRAGPGQMRFQQRCRPPRAAP